MNSFVAPSDSGRQPATNISSGFSGFTAEQWKNWTLYYSLFCLTDILPSRHYQCWQLFVKACFLFCRRKITSEEIEEADKVVFEFCTKFVCLYGKEHCTPNIHLHCHLKECIIDYGPVYVFWLFGFERLSGVMGSYHTNCQNISVQLTCRFLYSVIYAPNNWPQEFASDFLPLLEQFRYSQGSLNLSAEMSTISPLLPVKERSLHFQEIADVQVVLNRLYDVGVYTPLVLYKHATALQVGERVIGSHGLRYSELSIVFAKRLESDRISLAEVKYYGAISVVKSESESVEFETLTVWLAFVSWFEEHPCRVWYGTPTQVWCTTSLCSQFIPITNIRCCSKTSVNFGRYVGTDSVYVATPIILIGIREYIILFDTVMILNDVT